MLATARGPIIGGSALRAVASTRPYAKTWDGGETGAMPAFGMAGIWSAFPRR